MWEDDKFSSPEEEQESRQLYLEERASAWKAFLASPEGQQKYEKTFLPLLAFYRVSEPQRPEEAARAAALARLERLEFHFPEYARWVLTRQAAIPGRHGIR